MALVESAYSLSRNKVKWKDETFNFRFIPVALKGDWPFLRSAVHLQTGFSSLRKCHLCSGEVPRRWKSIFIKHVLLICPSL